MNNICDCRIALAVLALLAGSFELAAAEPKVRFNRDIRPILSDNCFRCHGHDPKPRQADLRLDLRESAIAARDGKAAVVPGKSEQSELVARIFSDDADQRMPPAESHKSLTHAQKELLRRWIVEGSQYEGHWAYQPIVRPPVPEVRNPKEKIRNPIDAFIQSQLEAENLAPSSEAEKRILIRRVYLDLIGLPPTLEQVRAFVADNGPSAYEKVVNELLASPRFAEKQAIAWLDAVRYADTVGFHGDQMVNVWPFRDYVLRAFRDNMPFDQFTREQIAGDLMPEAGRRGKVASAFNRLNRMTTEGGAQDKEYLAKYAADRIRTVSMVWMGSTMGCTECHDHKFDPFKTKDFYAMQAFFADVKERGFYPSGFAEGDWGPEIKLATDEQSERLYELDERLKSNAQKRASVTDEQLSAGRAAWEKSIAELDEKKQLRWTTVTPLKAASANGATLTIQSNFVMAGGHNPDNDAYTVTFKPGAGRWTALELITRTSEEFPGNGYARGWKSAVVTEIEVEAATGAKSAKVRALEVAADERGRDDKFPAWAVIDGDPSTGWSYPHHASMERWVILRFAEPLAASDDTVVTVRVHHDYPIRHATLAGFRLRLSRVDGASSDEEGIPPKVLEALRASDDKRTEDQRKLLAFHYRSMASELADLRREDVRLAGQRALLNGNIPAVLTTEAVAPRPIRVLPRGNWMDDSGEVVSPAIPSFLGSLKAKDRSTRLDLANWLTSPENPLTARVIANRVWKPFFGAGLSRVLEDVGSQGEWPSHPELLDWLAAEFMKPAHAAEAAHAWDYKHLVRLIVTSHAYRQSSAPRPELEQRDPENRLLARQVPIRLDAEIIRDNALAVSGLLVNEFGGASVFPPQPTGYWAPLNFPKREYSASLGEDLHRRSLYTHWQRTFLHPTMLTFDAATREECQVNRAVSTTPLQALVLLNDPIYVEAAASFGREISKAPASSPSAKIEWGFETALARKPLPSEIAVLSELFESERKRFSQSPEDAKRLLAGGPVSSLKWTEVADLAAMTVVARTILNLSETITRY